MSGFLSLTIMAMPSCQNSPECAKAQSQASFSAVGRNDDGFLHHAGSIKPFFTLWSKANIRSRTPIGFLSTNFSLPDDVDSLALGLFLMPKPIARSKTRKSVAKRFKITSTGKVLRTRAAEAAFAPVQVGETEAETGQIGARS